MSASRALDIRSRSLATIESGGSSRREPARLGAQHVQVVQLAERRPARASGSTPAPPSAPAAARRSARARSAAAWRRCGRRGPGRRSGSRRRRPPRTPSAWARSITRGQPTALAARQLAAAATRRALEIADRVGQTLEQAAAPGRRSHASRSALERGRPPFASGAPAAPRRRAPSACRRPGSSTSAQATSSSRTGPSARVRRLQPTAQPAPRPVPRLGDDRARSRAAGGWRRAPDGCRAPRPRAPPAGARRAPRPGGRGSPPAASGRRRRRPAPSVGASDGDRVVGLVRMSAGGTVIVLWPPCASPPSTSAPTPST